MSTPTEHTGCPFCGYPRDTLLHILTCDGRQGTVEAEADAAVPQFDGDTYDPALDEDRLRTQLGRVFALMADGRWRTLAAVQTVAGGSEAACSARLRDLRKPKFGGYTVEHRRCGAGGLWEYRLVR
jgi:hypothetical protein